MTDLLFLAAYFLGAATGLYVGWFVGREHLRRYLERGFDG